MRALPNRLFTATVGAMALAASASMLTTQAPKGEWSSAVQTLCEPAAEMLRQSRTDTVVMPSQNGADLSFLAFGCLATFTRDGIDVRLPQAIDDVLVPGHGLKRDGTTAPQVIVVTGSAAVTDALARPGADVLATLTPSDTERGAGIPDAAVIRRGIGFT